MSQFESKYGSLLRAGDGGGGIGGEGGRGEGVECCLLRIHGLKCKTKRGVLYILDVEAAESAQYPG